MAEETGIFQLLKAIAGKPALFRAALDAARRSINLIVGAQLSADAADLASVRKIAALLGPAAFAEAVDGLPSAKVKALVARIDPLGPAPAAAPERIRHLLALAEGKAQPATAKAKPSSKGKTTASVRPGEAAPADGKSEAAPRRRRITGRAALRASDER